MGILPSESIQSDRSISVSELKKWMKCRLLWFFSAAPPRALGLSPTNEQSDALTFGRLAHEVLEDGYNGDRNFAEIYEAKVAPLRPKVTSLFANQADSFQKVLDTGKVMMEGYEEWSVRQDQDVQFIETETNWKGIPIWGIDQTMSAIIDAMVLRRDGLWLLDYKTTSSATNPWTSQDLQATVYIYAGKELIDPDIQGIIFRFLLKTAPWTYEALLLKDGTLTKRKNIANLTTHREYLRAIAISTLKSLVAQGWQRKHIPSNSTLRELATWANKLVKKEHPEFMEYFKVNQKFYYDQLSQLKSIKQGYFWDDPQPRSDYEIKTYMNGVVIPNLLDMTNITYIGPTGVANAWNNCGRCQFKEPCMAYTKGQDWRGILTENYVVNDHYLQNLDDEEEVE